MAQLHILEKSVFFPYPVEKIFAYHSNINTLIKLVPDYVKLKVLNFAGDLVLGDKVLLWVRVHGFPFLWRAQITEYKKNVSFTDSVRHGPFPVWLHHHIFEAKDGGTLMTDRVEYTLPFWLFGEIAHDIFVKEELEKIFATRHEKALKYLAEEMQ